MSKYFAKYPSTMYTLSLPTETSQVQAVTDITKRIGINKDSLSDNLVFLDHDVRDGDTPENLAHRYYGDSEKHWIILMANNIIDPQFDWPLDERTLGKYIEKKYVQYANTGAGQTGFEWANLNNESFYRIETKTSDASDLTVIDYYQIDELTYNALNVENESYTVTLPDGANLKVSVDKSTRTYYQYEIKVNEDKRKIKVLHKDYVPQIMNQFKNIFN